jgi:hypothetical protein
MNTRTLPFTCALVGLLTACGQMPKTADEYRTALQQHPNMVGVRIEHFDVALPMSQSAQFVKKKTTECLQVTVRRTSKTSSGGMTTSYSDALVKYQPYVDVSKDKATIYVTETASKLNGEQIGDPYFTFVMDIKPAAARKSNVDLYYTWGEPRPRIAKALTAWAAGNDIGCPNLAAS